MRNYRELVYSVLDELKMFSDDNVWETGHIVSALNKYRALLFTQKYKGKKVEIPSAYYQRLYVVFDTTYNESKLIYKSLNKIPLILDITDLWKYTFVSNDGITSENMNFISPQRFKNTGYNKWLRNQIYVTIDLDNKMCIKDSSLTPKILVGIGGGLSDDDESALISEDGLFQLVSEDTGELYVYYDVILDNPIDGYRFNNDESLEVLDFDFHCEESLVQPIIDLCLKEFGNLRNQRTDIQNNSYDDLNITRAQERQEPQQQQAQR